MRGGGCFFPPVSPSSCFPMPIQPRLNIEMVARAGDLQTYIHSFTTNTISNETHSTNDMRELLSEFEVSLANTRYTAATSLPLTLTPGQSPPILSRGLNRCYRTTRRARGATPALLAFKCSCLATWKITAAATRSAIDLEVQLECSFLFSGICHTQAHRSLCPP